MAAPATEDEIREASLPVQIVDSVVEIWTNAQKNGRQCSFSSAMAQGLALAGLAHRGQEAVQIHACLLDKVLQKRYMSLSLN
ncbi:hypothetical protein ElyMa_006868100 [Elysia marginata]|uniref:Uncharacterized protein n=1 Tax=Elysia marginata TaxID=1093978 RepID=A0AAV4JCP2_9GAST|nr:hypothetical protein ElyMa_006868100 [Elysia marginata]